MLKNSGQGNLAIFQTPEALPLLTINAVIQENSRVLVVAPHPDDETLGCGGAIALLRQLNIPVTVVVVSDGTKSHPNSKTYPPPALKKLREQESLAALKILGIDSGAVSFLGMADGAVHDSCTGQAIAFVTQALIELNPAIVFLPWRQDPHPDHRASWQLFITAMNNLPVLPRLLEYPIWDWDSEQRGEFTTSINAWRLDISKVIELKRQAIAQYRSQISDLINDDPEGFRLTPQMQANFTQPWEIYLELT